MPFSDWTEYTRGRKRVTSLTDTAQELFPITDLAKISHVIITSGSAQVTVIFRAIDDVEDFRVKVPANETRILPGWQVGKGGLEVITAAADGNTEVTAFYAA